MNAALGLGTYRIAGEELSDAARRTASSPAVWIDTAPNYNRGRAQRLLAPVLAAHPGLNVATKTGFLTPATARAALAAGVVYQVDATASPRRMCGGSSSATGPNSADTGSTRSSSTTRCAPRSRSSRK